MIKALKNITGQKFSSASVVDGKLILSFPHAQTPVVWQMDLSSVKASSLEVLHDEKEGIYTLTLKTPKGEKINAAKFLSREDAVSGLMAASQALEGAHGRIQGGKVAANQDKGLANTANPAPKKRSRWITGLIAGAVLFILFNIWVSMLPKAPNSFQQSSGSGPQGQNISPADSAGVPVSADEFLNAQ